MIGVGIRASMASCQFIANSTMPMPRIVSRAMTRSWKPVVMKSRMRSASFVTLVMIRPVLWRL